MELTFNWNGNKDRIAYDRSGGDQGRLYLANTCRRLMTPFVPAKNLVLSRNVRTYVENGEGIVHYLSPYAHYQYEGILYVSSRTGSPLARFGEHKVPAVPKRALVQSEARHSQATSNWDKAMWAARKNDIIGSYQRWLNRRART